MGSSVLPEDTQSRQSSNWRTTPLHHWATVVVIVIDLHHWTDLNVFLVVESSHRLPCQMDRMVIVQSIVVRHTGFSVTQATNLSAWHHYITDKKHLEPGLGSYLLIFLIYWIIKIWGWRSLYSEKWMFKWPRRRSHVCASSRGLHFSGQVRVLLSRLISENPSKASQRDTRVSSFHATLCFYLTFADG